jgi:hypothetical protein
MSYWRSILGWRGLQYEAIPGTELTAAGARDVQLEISDIETALVRRGCFQQLPPRRRAPRPWMFSLTHPSGPTHRAHRLASRPRSCPSKA